MQPGFLAKYANSVRSRNRKTVKSHERSFLYEEIVFNNSSFEVENP